MKMSMSARLLQRALLAPASKNLVTARTYAIGSATSARECLAGQAQTDLTTLKNGFRVASENNGMPTATIGVYIEAGSANESAENSGVGNFVEHMSFKGTDKRSLQQLEQELEGIGAQLNGYTAREHTAYYVKCLSHDVDKAVEILADITQNSKFDQAAMEKEKGVILRQIDENEQNAQEVVFDFLHKAAYQRTPLERPVFGTTENIKAMTRQQLVDFVQSLYRPQHMVLVGAGGVEHNRLASLGEQHFGKLSSAYPGTIPQGTEAGVRFTGSELHYFDYSMPFVYAAIAVECVGVNDQDSLSMQLANMLIGSYDRTHGSGSNSPYGLAQMVSLNQGVQAYQAFTTQYKNTGLWGTYFVTEETTAMDMVDVLAKEWRSLCTSLSHDDVARAKNLLKTQLLLSLDGTTPMADDIGRSILTRGRRVPVVETIQAIDSLTVDNVRDACMRHIYDRDIVVGAAGPLNAFWDYVNIRGKLSWWRM